MFTTNDEHADVPSGPVTRSDHSALTIIIKEFVLYNIVANVIPGGHLDCFVYAHYVHECSSNTYHQHDQYLSPR